MLRDLDSVIPFFSMMLWMLMPMTDSLQVTLEVEGGWYLLAPVSI